MSELLDLYQEVILDHNKSPRNFGPLPEHNRAADGDNPLCGDQVRLEVELQDGVLRKVRFQGRGCAISTASASLMTEALEGKSVEEAEALFESFHDLLTASGSSEGDGADLGKLEAFRGVREYPMRVKWAALAGSDRVVSTEL
jgi:nitrogen fixation NifU-like protein